MAVPPLLLETDEDVAVCDEAQPRRAARLLKKTARAADRVRPASRVDTFFSLSTLCSRSMPTR